MLSRILSRTSPWGLLAAGLAVGIAASPGIRKGFRKAAVKTTRLALSVTDGAKGCAGKIGEGFGGIVTEAKAQEKGQGKEQTGIKAEAIKSKVRAAGVTAVGSGIAAVDKVKDVSGGLKQKWDNIVSEARETKKDQLKTAADINTEKREGPEKTAPKKAEPAAPKKAEAAAAEKTGAGEKSPV